MVMGMSAVSRTNISPGLMGKRSARVDGTQGCNRDGMTASAAHLYQDADTPKARATCSSSRTLIRPRPNLERLTSHTVRRYEAADQGRRGNSEAGKTPGGDGDQPGPRPVDGKSEGLLFFMA